MTVEQSLFISKAEKYAIERHAGTNHNYDKYLPYEFHLRMVVKMCMDFINYIPLEYRYIVIAACWCHDIIEDARETYGDVMSQTNEMVAEIARAVTNYGRGRNRDERMPDFVYLDIKQTQFATFVKLCDRIANFQYSKMTGSSMFKKYVKEHTHFKEMLFVEGEYEGMWNYIDTHFINIK